MKRWLAWLMTSLVLVLAGSYAWTHRHHVRIVSAAEPAPQPEASYGEAQEAQKMVTVTGPMADYVQGQQQAGAHAESASESNSNSNSNSNLNSDFDSNTETLQSIAHKPSALDHVGDSPVGTSAAILHRAFRIASVVEVPFEIPAHASNPQLQGTYRSFQESRLQESGLQQSGGQQDGVVSDSSADVDFLLMNEQQYADFLSDRPGDALFSADSAHNGEINFNLPPTLAKGARYYLVFRNNSRNEGKKVVQADFRVDF